MKRLIVALAFAGSLFAQNTTVSATVTGADGSPYANGTYTATITNGQGQSLYLVGLSLPASFLPVVTGSLDASGSFSVPLLPNASIVAGSKWRFVVCSSPIYNVCFSSSQIISGSNQSLSVALSLLAPTQGPTKGTDYATKQYVDTHAGSGGGATIPAVTNVLIGNGAGNGADSGISATQLVTKSGTNGITGTIIGSGGGHVSADEIGGVAATIGTSGASLQANNGNNTHSGANLVTGSFDPSGGGTVNSNRVNGAIIPVSSQCTSTNSGSQLVAIPCGIESVPPQASAVGYLTQTLASSLVSSEFNFGPCTSASTWAGLNFNSQTPSTSASVSFAGPGYSTIGVANERAEFSSACQDPVGTQNWHGTVYGGGGYFEMIGAYNTNTLQGLSPSSWPSFWCVDIECNKGVMSGFIDPNCWWNGQGLITSSIYAHPVEVDIFEGDAWSFSSPGHSDWIADTMREAWGIFGSTCTAYCAITTPITVRPEYQTIGQQDYNQFHRYGFLWVPATSTNDKVGGPVIYSSGGSANHTGWCFAAANTGFGGTGATAYVFSNAGTLNGNLNLLTLGSGYTSVPTSWALTPVTGFTACSGTITTTGGWLASGYGSFYLDDVLVGSFGYQKFVNDGSVSPPPGINGGAPAQPWAYGVLDIKHLILIIQTGANTPMKIKAVNVWQTDASKDIHQ